MNTPTQNPETVDRQEEADPVLQRIEDDYQCAMVPIRRRMAEQSRSLKRSALAALFMTLLLGGSIWRDRHLNQQVASSSPAGQLLDLRPVQEPKGFKPVVLVVQTSTGFFSLKDPLNLSILAELVREERKGGRQYLCDRQCTQCAEIARADKP
jgi:hypothetical protein